MRLVVRTDRSFFSSVLRSDGKDIWSYVCRWMDVTRNVTSDLQRQYLASILVLKRLKEDSIVYTDLKLKVDGKIINKQISGKMSTGTYAVAELRSELLGLMTRMGVVLE